MFRPKQSLFARLLSRVTSACVVLLLMMAGGGTSVFAQTPAATIENSNSDMRFQVNYDGGLVAPGIFGPTTPADSIPATGAGTRMMWYPAKAAFRAGRLINDTDAWNATNVGNSSVAFGRDPIASGEAAVALGETPEATGENAVALGYNAQATGRRSVAMGEGARAFGDFATALGSSRAYGTFSTAMGFNTLADAQSSTALGQGSQAIGRASMVVGGYVEGQSDYSLSIGKYNQANTISGVNNFLFVAGNGTENARSDALILDKSGNLSVEGAFTDELGTFAGHFTASKNADETNNPDAHVAFIENTNTGADADALAIQTGPADGPDAGNNFVTFFDGDGTAIGRIEGNANTGVTYETSGADYAEELPVAETASSVPEATDLVGVRGGTVSLDTEGADRVMIASSHPAVTGNATSTTDAPRIDVAFVGQVPVQLRGTAEIGDLIVASGQNDGTARAVASDQYRRSEHGPVAGQAWSAKSTSGIGTVTVAVGLGTGDVLAEQLEEERARNDRQEQRIAALEERLTALEDHHSSVLAGLPGSWLLGGACALLLLGGGIGTVLRRQDR